MATTPNGTTSTTSEEAQQLRELFLSASRNIEDDVLSELLSIMRLHSIDAQELWYKWESYSMKMGSGGGSGEGEGEVRLDVETVRKLKGDVQSGLERGNRGRAGGGEGGTGRVVRGGVTPRGGVAGGDMLGMLGVPNTPRVGSANRVGGKKKGFETPLARVKQEPGSSPPTFKTPFKPGEQHGQGVVTSFNDRTNAGQEVEILNEQLSILDPPIAPYSEPRIKVAAISMYKKLSYKPLAMKSSEASEILDDQIDEFMTLIQEHHKLEDSAFGSAASQATNEIVAVGRICSDSSEGKLNASSLVLETSRRTGGGLRIPLKTNALPGYQFFPGQLVALRGINASGEDFTISEILSVPLLKSAASPPASIEGHIQRLRGPDSMDDGSSPPPLSILLGAGPYTADDNLDFEPLHALCSQAADNYADALILTGPFIDIDHPLIASGDFDLPDEAMAEPDTVTMSTVFKYLISPALNQLVASNPHITIILIPSVKDAISKHVSWPQEPFPKKDLGLPKSARIVGNPMTFNLNEINVAISSQDIFYELRHEELVAGKSKEEMMARLPKYLIEQRSFFPLFPPSARNSLQKTGTREGVPAGSMLDVSYLKLGEMVSVRPDLMIIPSSLPPSSRVVESVLSVNPGFLSKRKGPGTYAKITIHPYSLSDEDRASKTMLPHKLFDRARVDILRI